MPGGHLVWEGFGSAEDPVVLLVAGQCQSMTWWDEEFCRRLAAVGRFVVRYDHRDTGRSSTDPAGRPTYTGRDLVLDPLRLLDVIGAGGPTWSASPLVAASRSNSPSLTRTAWRH